MFDGIPHLLVALEVFLGIALRGEGRVKLDGHGLVAFIVVRQIDFFHAGLNLA